MTTVRKLVSKGLREAGILEIGSDPSADQFEEGLDLLQEIYSSFFGNELGEQLTTVNYGTSGLVNSYAIEQDVSSDVDSAYVPANVRLLLNINSPETLYLHPSPMDGARLGVIDNAGNLATYNLIVNGNGRKIENAVSVTLNTNGVSREWFYRADLGTWVKVIDLVAEDESPLPREFDALLSTILAIRLNPRYGAQTAGETSDVLKSMRKRFRARYRQTMEQRSEDGLVRLPSNPYWSFGGNSKNTFDRGNP